MPGIPLVTRDILKVVDAYVDKYLLPYKIIHRSINSFAESSKNSHSCHMMLKNERARGSDQMCHEDTRAHLSQEEETAAEESLSNFCKPVELYNILQNRATDRPSFLQRCLRYKRNAKNKKRIQMKISLSGGYDTQNLFPVYVLLAKSLSNIEVAEHTAVYYFRSIRVLVSYVGRDAMNKSHAEFILPEMNKLSKELVSGKFWVLLVSCAELSSVLWENDHSKTRDITSFPSDKGSYGLFGKISLETLSMSWEKSPNLIAGERTETLTTIDMLSCVVQPGSLEKEKFICFQFPFNSGAVNSLPLQVPVIISAEEVGAKEKTPYNSYSYKEVLSPSLTSLTRLRAGNVVFMYKYYSNKLQKVEVTEDFSCPFCLVKCASYVGLRHHLPASHDLFNFEFWVNEECQAVNVSMNTDQWRPEIVADGVDPKRQTFFLCLKPRKHGIPKSLVQNAKHVHPLVVDSDLPATISEHWEKIDGSASSPNATRCSSATAHSCADPECVQSVPGSNLMPPALLQFAKTRKLSAERSDSRNRTLLQRRQFFHSHRAQPMALEQVLSDRDSEDEVDDDVADFEDRRMLDDFVDVTKDEKQMMHLWNSFVRKQRVLADGHIPWACEAFSKLHGRELVLAPALLWCWRTFMIKLWNHGLLDARTMNDCNLILEKFLREDADSMRS